MGPESIRECCCYFSPYHPGIGIQTNTEATKKEETDLKVSCNGFEGELVKLERKNDVFKGPILKKCAYDISIYDTENQVTCSFTNVDLKDIKFLDGAVSFGG